VCVLLQYGSTALHLAACKGHMEVVDRLLEDVGAGFNAESPDKVTHDTYLVYIHQRTMYNFASNNVVCIPVVSLAPAQRWYGRHVRLCVRVALTHAGVHSNTTAAYVWIHAGTRTKTYGWLPQDGRTPLHVAAEGGHSQVVTQLLTLASPGDTCRELIDKV
jgi:hypothetical protein